MISCLMLRTRLEGLITILSLENCFSLENIQPYPIENEHPVKNSRYWSMERHQAKSFNEFVYFSLRDSVLKRVVNNV